MGASGDLAPLSHLAAVMIGVGEAFVGNQRLSAADALAQAQLQPRVLGAKEGLALLNGTQFSTACALAGVFEIETVLQAALVAGALSVEAAKGSDTPFDARIHALRGQPGQIATAAALRALMTDSAIRESHRLGDGRVQDPYCLRCQPQVMGAALDIMRQAARTLEIEANGVSDNPLVFSDTGEACLVAISTPSRWPSPPTCWRWRCAKSARSANAAPPCWWTLPCPACPPSSPRARA